ncbi:transcriptional regulator, TraR/DksA family [Caldanaerovirga acetigignens]|uniref:Transcriptional regulator, TraR/DksA family n=1 Tax=Caldanaerovirga acetigignens TaxID=447595 RepID=A0A1M7FV58_9FIRM|nr:TraR/DksA C4-type zinc finger protein [Caldanaerovirga acetigignens]SHM07964.1 transcriptional regulator, TraR/DksA family [Caldanaerovirga acetigignens]
MENKEYYRRKLEDLKRELESQMSTITRRGSEPLKESVGELSSYDNHTADLAAETFEREKDLGLRDNTKRMLVKVERALGKIEDGSYGFCEKCGSSIEKERLNLVPYTTLCAKCSKEEEKIFAKGARPVEEEVLKYPFGKSFRDDSENVGYDGEDAWQDVARYGTANTPQDEPGSVDYKEAYTDGSEERGITDKLDKVIYEDEPGKLGR